MVQLAWTETAVAPNGFVYQDEFVTEDEERALLENLSRLQFGTFEMHGVTARRRVLHFGWRYGYNTARVAPGPPIPDFLLPLRDRVAGWASEQPEAFAELLLTEYSAGAGIGWHRDAPAFGRIAGVSLLADCDFRFRPYPDGDARSLRVARRSVYLLDGEARRDWQHSIPPMKHLRYSLTFRTLSSQAIAPSA